MKENFILLIMCVMKFVDKNRKQYFIFLLVISHLG